MQEEKVPMNAEAHSQQSSAEGQLCNHVNRGLLNDSIKIMSGRYGGGFYAKYLFDENRGTGFIQLILEYPDGAIIPILLCKNVCRIAELDSDGVGTAKIQIPGEIKSYFELDKGKRKDITPSIESGIAYSSEDDYSRFVKYERPDFPIPMAVIWNQIMKLWTKLPITSWSKEIVLEDVYQSLLDIGERKAEKDEKFWDADGVFLTRDEINDVVKGMGYDFNDVRRIFEMRQLWLKDKGSLGYQYSKRINQKLERFYKLRKVEALNKISVNNKFEIEYSEKIK